MVLSLDGRRFEQVLSNLISNAVKYSPAEAPVLVRGLVHEGTPRIEVRDSGPGIPLEFQDHLFEPFSQGAVAPLVGRQQQGSTGLGLSIARKLTLKLGGLLSFETSEAGTCFFLDFPGPRNEEAGLGQRESGAEPAA